MSLTLSASTERRQKRACAGKNQTPLADEFHQHEVPRKFILADVLEL